MLQGEKGKKLFLTSSNESMHRRGQSMDSLNEVGRAIDAGWGDGVELGREARTRRWSCLSRRKIPWRPWPANPVYAPKSSPVTPRLDLRVSMEYDHLLPQFRLSNINSLVAINPKEDL